MSTSIGLFQQFPNSVRMLLVLSMVRAVSFFALLPFLPIYLHNEFGIGMEGVGYVLGLCMLGGTLMSVYGGYMVDRFDKLRFMVVLNIVLGALFFVLVPLHSKPAIFLILLLVNIGMSWMNVVGNVMLADLLPPDMRAKAVSLRYALQNIGAAVGPFLGVALMRYDQGAPFFLAAILTLLSAALLLIFRAAFSSSSRESEPRQAPVGFGETLITMRRDRRLVLFTLGGICSMAAYGPLLTYLTQYLIVVQATTNVYETIAWVSAANAVAVISLQYIVGTWIKEARLLLWITLGSGALVLGLLGLSISTALGIWIVAILIFTLGEIILAPAEFMLIDMIAPKNLRGSYFGAQNMVYLGVTIGPIVCGLLLNHAQPAIMFYVMIGITILGWFLYYLGFRHTGVSKEHVFLGPS